MRLLDTHEQKSADILMPKGKFETREENRANWVFPDMREATFNGENNLPPTGDYLSAEKVHIVRRVDTRNRKKRSMIPDLTGKPIWKTTEWDELQGNLVEIKIGKDFGIHTEQLERFQDELYRMRLWQKDNPKVDLHAVWMPSNEQFSTEIMDTYRQFVHLCCKYHVWSHLHFSERGLIEFLKSLDQPSKYIRDECFIKRDHGKVSILAKMIRQFPRISSEKAMLLGKEFSSNRYGSWSDIFEHRELEVGYVLEVDSHAKEFIYAVLGHKKDGTPTKLSQDFITYLEEGE